MSQKRYLMVVISLLAVTAALVMTGCGDDKENNPNPPGPTPTHLVRIVGFAYAPEAISVSPGDTVTWRNDDSVPHTVTSDSGNELQSPIMNPGATYEHVFATAGAFMYHCTVHSTMPHGLVNVQ